MDHVIFLDIDGVLNSNMGNGIYQGEFSNGKLIEEGKVCLLGELVHKTNAKIVLHSGWRFWFDNAIKPSGKEAKHLAELLRHVNIEIYDVTPDFSTEEIRRTKKFSLVKAKEIIAWLELHPDVCAWIVIDDLDLHNDRITRHQIKTNSMTGLTQKDIENAEMMLYNQKYDGMKGQ